MPTPPQYPGDVGFDPARRGLLLRGSAVAGASLAASSLLRAQSRTDTEPRTLNGQPVPEPPLERSAGPVKALRVRVGGGSTCE
jgi:hypothetical protein